MANLLALFDEAQAALTTAPAPQVKAEGGPKPLCCACGGFQFWQMPGTYWRCATCHPMNLEARRKATTLTLAGEVPTRKVVELDEAKISAALKKACYGLPITAA